MLEGLRIGQETYHSKNEKTPRVSNNVTTREEGQKASWALETHVERQLTGELILVPE